MIVFLQGSSRAYFLPAGEVNCVPPVDVMKAGSSDSLIVDDWMGGYDDGCQPCRSKSSQPHFTNMSS